MGETFRLAMQLTMIDMLSGVARGAENRIKQLGAAGKAVAKDFELMERNATRGLKAIAVANYAVNKIKPGVDAAGDMQESMGKVEMNLLRGSQNARSLHEELKKIKDTAIFVGANAPFTAKDIIDLEAQLLKSGISADQVTGKSGAAWTAAGLSALSGVAPSEVGTSLAKIGQTFKLKSGEEYKAVADWLEKAESSAGQDLNHLFYGFQRSGNAANNLGISPKDLTTMLTIAAPMGEEAGTGVKMFLERLSGAHKEEQKYIRGLGLNFWAKDKTAKFLGVDNAINEVRTKLSGVKNERLRNVFFSKIFREEGGAFAKLVANSDKSFKQWTDFIDEHKDINQKMSIWASEYNASWVKLITTAKSSSASVFDSWLIPLTKVNDTLNDIIGKVGEFAEKHPKVTDTFNGVLAAGVATAAGYAAFKLAKAAWYGGKVMKGLRGLPGASLAAGVAEGKMLQAATGVTPVFVTNWPEGGLGSDTPFVGPPKPKIPPETVNTVRNVLPFLKKMGFYSLAAPVAYLIGSNLEKLAGGTGEFNADQTPDNWKFQAPWSKDDQKNNIHIDLQIDSSGRVTSRTDSMDTRITMLPRGDFFTAMTSLPAGY